MPSTWGREHTCDFVSAAACCSCFYRCMLCCLSSLLLLHITFQSWLWWWLQKQCCDVIHNSIQFNSTPLNDLLYDFDFENNDPIHLFPFFPFSTWSILGFNSICRCVIAALTYMWLLRWKEAHKCGKTWGWSVGWQTRLSPGYPGINPWVCHSSHCCGLPSHVCGLPWVPQSPWLGYQK